MSLATVPPAGTNTASAAGLSRRWRVHSSAMRSVPRAWGPRHRGCSCQLAEMHETWATRSRAPSDALRSWRARTCCAVCGHECAGRRLASSVMEGATRSRTDSGLIRRLSRWLGASGS
eukprot:scaffold5584_cov110-Isochrysis_galbana.AAC.6